MGKCIQCNSVEKMLSIALQQRKHKPLSLQHHIVDMFFFPSTNQERSRERWQHDSRIYCNDCTIDYFMTFLKMHTQKDFLGCRGNLQSNFQRNCRVVILEKSCTEKFNIQENKAPLLVYFLFAETNDHRLFHITSCTSIQKQKRKNSVGKLSHE